MHFLGPVFLFSAHVLALLGPILRHFFGSIFGSFLDHFGALFVLLLGAFSFWVTFWDIFGYILGHFSINFGPFLGPCWDLFGTIFLGHFLFGPNSGLFLVPILVPSFAHIEVC